MLHSTFTAGTHTSTLIYKHSNTKTEAGYAAGEGRMGDTTGGGRTGDAAGGRRRGDVAGGGGTGDVAWAGLDGSASTTLETLEYSPSWFI